jgi:LmbE family N-acetylglucosaminyl deacetylase
MLTVLHLAPHPDDEALGAGATLIGLREAGHRVINLACGLGRRADHARRRAELEEACRRAGFELEVHDPPLDISSGDDLALAQARLAETLAELIPGRDVSVLVSPSPHDRHHGHQVVGRAAHEAVRGVERPGLHWWTWALWGELPRPTLVAPFGEERLARVLEVLSAHAGELARNDYAALLPARATVNRILGAERAFGYGQPGLDSPYADLFTEEVEVDGRWKVAAPRVLDPSALDDPLSPATCR